jgi:hypothetical protein
MLRGGYFGVDKNIMRGRITFDLGKCYFLSRFLFTVLNKQD